MFAELGLKVVARRSTTMPPAPRWATSTACAMNAQEFGLVTVDDDAWLTEDVPSLLGEPARSFQPFATGHATAFS